MSPDMTDQYRAYSTATRTAPKLRQIIMLYEGVIRFMQQARLAIEENRVEDRYNLLTRSSEIILNLQACLDFENGGQVAQTLHDFYSSIDARILSIHRSRSEELCDSVIRDLKEMCQVWREIDEKGTGEGDAQESIQKPAESPAEGAMQFSV